MRCLLLFGISMLLFSCYETERNCNDYKLGTFRSEISINDSIYSSTFTRTEELQIEKYNHVIDSSEVRWVNDCEVIFKTINPKNRIEKKDIHLKILTTTDSSYTFEYSYVGDTHKQKGTAFKIK
ncbi:DNA topoisomerase IV [Hanstruepera neustonica]|uniref:DNA topoisomerase IV n=1 Tax=Hanstruepera neustonica TaxID=1445657 RepID=A0A2K1DYA6_9FLAO|nr:DNA topoisomerase IV [Hanstruepera neustonica]PNQ73011.1 DNA topoisomerase IV [Hanstruepera neustonica]